MGALAFREVTTGVRALQNPPLPSRHLDCIVIGGGPAGLTAAIYLARFHLSVMVLDGGHSRARLIPTTHNHAGFPGGIKGTELVSRMAEQAHAYGAVLANAEVKDVKPHEDGFWIETSGASFEARAVLLATGVVNRRLAMPEELHDEALQHGLLRYCPICDGYEVTDKRVAVLGTGDHALREAEFLRSYSAEVTLVSPSGAHSLSGEHIARAAEWEIVLLDGPIGPLSIGGDAITIPVPSGAQRFDTAYMALGSDIRSELATAAGAETIQEGCIVVDRHQQTTVPGLYAAGDVVLGLDQISNAMGQAGVAATAIRNMLCARSPLRRQIRVPAT